MLPRPIIHSGTTTIKAGQEVWLFTEVADFVRDAGQRVPVKVVLLSFTTTRDKDLWLQFFDARDPLFEPLNTNGLPGLDHLVEPVALTVHVGHELRCKAINRGTADKDLTYFFYLEQRREDGVMTRQYVFAGSPTLAPREDGYEAAKIVVAPDEIGILYRLSFDRNPAILAFITVDGQYMPPTDGIACVAVRGIAQAVPVYYTLSGPEGDRELRVILKNTVDAEQEFPYRVLAHVYKVKEEAPEGGAGT